MGRPYWDRPQGNTRGGSDIKSLKMAAGILAWTGRLAGYWIGVFVAGVAMVLWFFMIFSAPFAALLGVGLNALVMCGLTVGANSDEF